MYLFLKCSDNWIQEQARIFASHLEIEDFGVSNTNSWFAQFKTHHNISAACQEKEVVLILLQLKHGESDCPNE